MYGVYRMPELLHLMRAVELEACNLRCGMSSLQLASLRVLLAPRKRQWQDKRVHQEHLGCKQRVQSLLGFWSWQREL